MTNKQLLRLKKKYIAEGYKLARKRILKESNVTTREELLDKIDAQIPKARGRWRKAVLEDAYRLIEQFDEEGFEELANAGNFQELRKILLGGARDEKQWSESGFGLIYNEYIAKHYCTPSELKKVAGGRRQPNSRETWIDVQARAIFQAIRAIAKLI